jgi:sec-independent protein translocase protein TatC
MPEALAQLPPDDQDSDAVAGKMGFLEHLDELRKRIIRSCIAIAVGMGVAFFFVDRLGAFILAPTLRILPPGEQLIFTRAGEGFAFYFDIALIGGVVLAAPVVMYQVWRFIAPGLYADEKRFAIPFVLLTTIGTLAGALFSHYVLFPSTIAFFGSFTSPSMKFVPRVEDTFELYKKMLLGMVLIFQMPTVVFFLAKMRLVTARFLWRNIKYAVLIIFILAAVMTTSSDPWNQTVFAMPMIALYLISIGIAWLVGPRGQEAAATRSGDATKLRLVFAATVIDQARMHRRRSPAKLRRVWNRGG